MFARAGLHAATVEQIADEAGINRQSIYELFADKQAVFDAAVQELCQALNDLIPESVRNKELAGSVEFARGALSRYYRYFERNPTDVLLYRDAWRMRHVALLSTVRAVRRRYVELLPRLGVPEALAEAVGIFTVGLMESMLTAEWDGEPLSGRQMIEALTCYSVGGANGIAAHADQIFAARSDVADPADSDGSAERDE